MNFDGLLLVLGGTFVLGAFLAWLARAHFAKQAKALTSEVQAIANARPGKVQLIGRLVSDEAMESPVSGKPCLYMRIQFRDENAGFNITTGHTRGRYYMRAEAAGKNKEIIRKVDHVYLEDESGRVELDLEDAEMELLIDKSYRTGTLGDDSPEVQTLMRRFGANLGSGGRAGRCQLTEVILEKGDLAVVSGKLSMDGAGNMLLTGTLDEPVFLTDKSPEEVAKKTKANALWMTLLFGALLAMGAVLVALSFLSPPPEKAPVEEITPKDTTRGW